MTNGSYGDAFFTNITGASIQSARRVMPLVVDLLKPRSLLELGSGRGAWTMAARDLGVPDCLAVDGAWVRDQELLIPPACFCRHDLEKPIDLNRKFDLVMSLEVAEHLKPSAADSFVQSLTAHGDVVLFSAASMYQGGTRHLNEQWPQYWIEKFSTRGYVCYDVVRPMIWNEHAVSFYYKQNAFLFVRAGQNDALHQQLKLLHADLYSSSEQLAFIHPDKYAKVATYQTVSIRRLLPRLPRILLVDFPVLTGEKLRDWSQSLIRR
jgi:hypothetical protein